MISIHQKKVLQVQDDFKVEIEKQRENALNKLKQIDQSIYNSDEIDYLKSIITLYEKKNILIKKPNEIEVLKKQIKSIPPNSKSPKKGLKKELLDSLDYSSLRSSFYPKYFYKIGIKACVYCNSVLTISTQKKKPRSFEHKGNFDVDHYHSKDEYPFLSIFLFNLYPACAPCNRKKSKSSSITFELYSDDQKKVASSQFKFEFDKGSIAKYLLTKDKEDLHFIFHSGVSGFQDTFGIQQIYETQKDVIEELVVKKHMYDKDNRESLHKIFSKLNLNADLYLRTMVGNYTKEKDIHKRPLSKFTQDIARDLGIIE